jgi:hypothetical protein
MHIYIEYCAMEIYGGKIQVIPEKHRVHFPLLDF